MRTRLFVKARHRQYDMVPTEVMVKKNMKWLMLVLVLLPSLAIAQTTQTINWNGNNVRNRYYNMCGNSSTSSSSLATCTSCSKTYVINESDQNNHDKNVGWMSFKAPTGCSITVTLTTNGIQAADWIYISHGLTETSTTGYAAYWNYTSASGSTFTSTEGEWITVYFDDYTQSNSSSFTITISCNCSGGGGTGSGPSTTYSCTGEVVQVGDGTTSSWQYGPVCPYYEQSYRQILYTSADFNGQSGEIKAIAFQYAYTSAMTTKADVKVYMANTAVSEFATSTSFITSGLQLVYSGSMNYQSQGWAWITLDTPFEYDGTNLLVVIDDDSGEDETSTSYAFYYTAGTVNRQLYTQTMGTNYGNDNLPTSPSISSYRPNTKFCIDHNCNIRPDYFAFANPSISIVAGDTYTQNVTGGTGVIYSMTCTPAGIATFNSSTHTVTTIAGAVGTVTVTAKWPASDGYCDKYASYTITIGDGCAMIGDGSNTSGSGTYGGVYTWSNAYAYTQQIYKAAEIYTAGGCAGVVESIALHYAETSSTALSFEVYLGLTNQNTVPTTWITDANLRRVYNGTKTFTSDNDGWNCIDISAANWEWDGVSNIVVAIRRTSSTEGNVSWPDFYHTNSSSMSAYVSNSSSAITLNSNNVATNAGTNSAQRPEMKFCIMCCSLPDFSFDEPIVYCVNGSACAGQTISVNQSGGAVTYESSNTSVATVNQTTGAVTIAGSGTTTITATVAKTDEYCSNTATYTLIVRCSATPHTITYNTQANCSGGTASPATWTYTGTTATIPNTTPVCSSANHFIGWYENVNGTGTRYTAGQTIDLTCGDFMLYAVYATEPDTIDGTTDCESAQAFCASNDGNNGVVLRATPGTGAAPSGMCGYYKNPSWWYMQVSQAGRLEMTIASDCGDVDFGCWGPFRNFTCSPDSLSDNEETETWYTASSNTGWGLAGATANDAGSDYHGYICGVYTLAYPCGNIVDFGAGIQATEYLQIDNAQVGDVYVVVIGNWANCSGTISFTQTNIGAAGAGMADCDIVANCDINVITTHTTQCNTADNTYAVSGEIYFTDAPTSGTLTITDETANPPVSQVFNAPFNSPTSYSLQVPSDGAIHHLGATFSATDCTKPAVYQAPDPCVDCASSVTHTDVSCHGVNDGTITLTSTNGRGWRAYYIGANGSTPTLSDSLNATSYTWDHLAPGTYTVFVRDTTNCMSEQTVVISDRPEVTLTLTVPANGCPLASGQNYAITANPSGGTGAYQNYSWSVVTDGSAGTISGSGSNATIVSDGSCHEYVVSLSLTDGNNCPASANKTFRTVDNTPPTITTTATNNQDWGCDPTNVVAPTFTATDNCPTAGTALTPTVTTAGPQSGANCTVSQTWRANVTDNCNNAATEKTITYTWKVSQVPTIDAIADQNAQRGTSGCKYKMIDLQAVTLAAAHDGCGGTVTFVSQSVEAGHEYTQTNVQQTIPVTVTVRGTCGRTATATVNVIIPANDLTVSIDQTGASVCAGGDTTLTATGSSSNGTPIYAWSATGSATVTPTTGTSTTATATGAATVTVTATDPAGCTATDQIDISINPEVTLSVSPETQEKCLGVAMDNVTITVTNGTIENESALQAAVEAFGLTYNNGVISGTPNAPGTHTFNFTAVSSQTPQCGSVPGSFTINVTNLITPVIVGDENICVTASEQNTVLSLSETAGNNTFTYNWSVGDGTILSGQGSNAITAQWSSPGEKTVIVTLTLDECQAQAQKTIYVRPVPTATIASVTDVVCPNAGTIDVTGTNTATTANYTYTWGGTMALTPATATVTEPTHTVTATVPTDCNSTYNITLNVTDNYGCKNAATPITVTVKDDEAPTVVGTMPTKELEGCNVAVLTTAYPAATTVAELEAAATALSGSLTVSDNCTTDKTQLRLQLFSQTSSGSCPIVVTRKYIVKDLCDNVSDTIRQIITINMANDITVSTVPSSRMVLCESWAVTDSITLPTVTDACNEELLPIGTPAVNNEVANCNGDKAFTYTYRDCANHEREWTFTFTVTHPNLVVPGDSLSAIGCLEDTSNTFLPAPITDACGNTVAAALVGTPDMSGYDPVGETGTVVFNYQYTDCTGNNYPWVLTYDVQPSAFTPTAQGASTVSCIGQATLQEPEPRVVCGMPVVYTANPANPIDTPTGIAAAGGCGTRVYEYTYEVHGNPYTWRYTYTIRPDSIVFSGNVPTRDTVECDDPLFVPTLPTVATNCGLVVDTVLTTSGSYTDCEGNRVWSYAFTDCAGHSRPWTFTRVIKRTTLPNLTYRPAETEMDVECIAAATAPTDLPTVKDVCGNILSDPQPVPVVTDDLSSNGCSGTRTYTYTYTDCAGLDTVWTYTYNIQHTTPPAEKPNGVDGYATAPTANTVQCLSNATTPTALPVVLDVCGTVLEPLPGSGEYFDTITDCEGTRTYKYYYKDCQQLQYEWRYVYTIDRTDNPTEQGTPVATSMSVACESHAVIDSIAAMPVVQDRCGETLQPVNANPTANTAAFAACHGQIKYEFVYRDCANLEFPWTFTFDVDMPVSDPLAAGAANVACEGDAVEDDIQFPTHNFACGTSHTISAADRTAAPTIDITDGTGTVTYHYEYSDCEGNPYTWDFVYTVTPSSLTLPEDTYDTVFCVASVAMPTPPVLRECGVNLLDGVVPVYESTMAGGCGDTTFVFRYHANGADTAWRFHYHVEPADFTLPTDGETTVECYNDETPDAALVPVVAAVNGICEAINPSAPVRNADGTDTYDGCQGDVTYTYTYSNCKYSHTWKYTYHVQRTTVPQVSNVATGSYVTCADLADGSFALPTVTDVCGATIDAPAPVVTPDNEVANCNSTKVYTYTYVDPCNAALTSQFVYTYTINDTVKPTIGTIPTADIPAAMPQGNCQYSIPSLESVVMANAGETCSQPIWGGQTPAVGTIYDAQATATTVPVVVTVRDECNNARTAIINVAIPANNLQLPTIAGVSICENETTMLTASPTTNAEAMPINCVWTTGSTTIIQGEAPLSITVSPMVSTTYDVTVTDQAGCTASRSVVVSVNYPTNTAFTQTVCEGYTWTNHGWSQTYNVGGDYTHTYTSAQGCSSTDTLHLTVYYNTNTEFIEQDCDSYTWTNNGWSQTYTTSGDYQHNYQTAEGCASTDVLHLTINHNSNATYNEAACDSYTWDNHGFSETYTTSGVHYHGYISAEGCPSTDVLNLTIYYSGTGSESATECEEYRWHGTTYTNSGEYEYHTNTTHGCDSVVTLHLTIINSYNTDLYDTVCYGEPYTWYNETFTGTGNHTHMLVSSNGCDSLLTMHLYQLPAVRVSIDEMHSCRTAQYTLTANSTNADQFEWWSEPDNGELASQTNEAEVTVLPLATTTYHVKSWTAGYEECAVSASITVEPVRTARAAIDAHPEYLTIDRTEWNATDRGVGADWREWYVDGVYYGDANHINGQIVPAIDSLSLVLIVGTGECADTARRSIPYINAGLWLPNVFTPSQDDNNRFGAVGTGIYNYKLWVYTREGLRVFYSESMGDKWDGTHNGTKCPQGTYTYRVAYSTIAEPESEIVEIGTVMLLR